MKSVLQRSLKISLAIPFIFSVLSVSFSAVALFKTPSYESNSSDYLFELDLQNADFDNIYYVSSNRTLSFTDLNMDPIYRFGLWGYCSGSRAYGSDDAVTSANVNSFVKDECSAKKKRYQLDIPDIFTSAVVLKVGEYFNVNLPGGLEYTHVKESFNGLFAGFILSIVTLATLIVLSVAVHFLSTGRSRILLHGISSITLASSFAQWISILVGVTYTNKSVNSILSVLSDNYGTLLILAKKGHFFQWGWSAMAMSLLCLVTLVAALIIDYFVSKDNDKVFPASEEVASENCDVDEKLEPSSA